MFDFFKRKPPPKRVLGTSLGRRHFLATRRCVPTTSTKYPGSYRANERYIAALCAVGDDAEIIEFYASLPVKSAIFVAQAYGVDVLYCVVPMEDPHARLASDLGSVTALEV